MEVTNASFLRSSGPILQRTTDIAIGGIARRTFIHGVYRVNLPIGKRQLVEGNEPTDDPSLAVPRPMLDESFQSRHWAIFSS
jgi:hypothetical protein